MKAHLALEDGSLFEGKPFGALRSTSGEVVFNTGMVGYPESMTDPSYRGQILTFTYPLIGNYGVPADESARTHSLDSSLESGDIQVKGIVVSTLSSNFSHWTGVTSLERWMQSRGVCGIAGIDTRALTRRLRSRGTMLGKIIVDGADIAWDDPNKRKVVDEVSVKEPLAYDGEGGGRVILVDFGCKNNIIRSLLAYGVTVRRVPWTHDWSREEADGVVLSNGPGDPTMCADAVAILKRGIERGVPILGICLGHQLLALASGAETYKLRFGHRGQNQPCIEVGSRRCFMTSQNHGYAVEPGGLGPGWQPWFCNANDGTNEGIRHTTRPHLSVQFHPEASPGPSDTSFVFDLFMDLVRDGKRR